VNLQYTITIAGWRQASCNCFPRFTDPFRTPNQWAGEDILMTEFTPLYSTLGGMLIGLSAVVLMASLGRIAGMTGIIAGLLPPHETPKADNLNWRLVFLAGAIAAPVMLKLFGFAPGFSVPSSKIELVVGGLLVGIGVHYGAGCPSGHGICGLARFSPRSLAAVITFMATTAITVFLVRHGSGV
jgi:uncharacterized protein